MMCKSYQDCSREGSRLVRKVLDKNFYPIFESHGLDTSKECPLSKSRDLYLVQEQHKLFEHSSRWTCNVCGKAFYRQEFLDLHMENKHEELLVKQELLPVCLADYCQLFRCEVVKRESRNKFFWRQALCSAENMAKLKQKCLNLVKSCVPRSGDSESYKQVYNEVIEETCLLISCQDYWQPLEYEISTMELLYYLTVTPILIMVLGLYYYNIWDYYCGDDDEEDDGERKRKKRHTKKNTRSFPTYEEDF
ncbi:uncharacterized protein LOC124437547 isoform X2 [Xenia sp. Carnegie-2017]|uniref:uncharacterized protein LOC124437547 isoform X2 n=1 Tax=Xenia sp. Carnegie-2017 TaxID=2897299 RepID=UPI001F03E0B4|nr:uncharacterized protein LOC124437547 isoform X2 [Xenia sp. Carnegie-2017]